MQQYLLEQMKAKSQGLLLVELPTGYGKTYSVIQCIKKYIEMGNAEFLIEIGACVKDRATGELKIKRGTLLFLGKVNSIKELFPHYHVDYFNRRGDNPRWSDRVSDDEPSDYEMNLYNFYGIVYEKIKNLLNDSFALDLQQYRLPLSDFDETLRECLVNCLAHADYIQG